MQRLRRVEKDTVNAHTVHGSLEFASDLSALTDAAHDELSPTLYSLHQLGHSVPDALLSERIRSVEHFQIGERIPFGRDNVQSNLEGCVL